MSELINLLNQVYDTFGITIDPTSGDLWGILSVLFLLFSSLTQVARSKSLPQQLPPPTEEEVSKELAEEVVEEIIKEVEAEKIIPPLPQIPWSERLKKGLSRSRQEVWGKLELVFSSATGRSALSEEKIEEIEEILFGADIGPTMVAELMNELQQNAGKDFSARELKQLLFDFLYQKMAPTQENVDQDLYSFKASSSPLTGLPKSIMIVGVNGAGKTTTIGKLATKLTRQGAKVMVGACDTFRAAAVDQLEIWCKRAGAEMIRAKEGADPSGVAFEALQQAKTHHADYCLLDTAGRLHTKANLMEELKKSKRVLSKLDGDAPQQVLLVIDAITGQNALKQAVEFHKALNLTGLIFTKCDGSSKAGNAVAIIEELKVPIVYIGVGEDVDDLNHFDLTEYLNALLNIED